MDHPEILHPLLFRHGFVLVQCGVILEENNGHILCHELPKSEGAREHSGTIKRKEGAEPFPMTSFTEQIELEHLQSREEGLQRVDPRVHELPTEHVHVDIEGRTPSPSLQAS